MSNINLAGFRASTFVVLRIVSCERAYNFGTWSAHGTGSFRYSLTDGDISLTSKRIIFGNRFSVKIADECAIDIGEPVYAEFPLHKMSNALLIAFLRREIAAVLRRAGIEELAISKFLGAMGAQLREAVQRRKPTIRHLRGLDDEWPAARLPNETPVAYIQRKYGDLLSVGAITQADLAKIDKRALDALRNYCANRTARPIRPRVTDILPSSKVDPDAALSKYGGLTYSNSVGAWKKDPSRENLERKRAYGAFQARKSRKRCTPG